MATTTSLTYTGFVVFGFAFRVVFGFVFVFGRRVVAVAAEHECESEHDARQFLPERFFLEPLFGHVEVPHHPVDALHEPW